MWESVSREIRPVVFVPLKDILEGSAGFMVLDGLLTIAETMKTPANGNTTRLIV